MGDKALTGSAGVHYIAFQLSSRGKAVGLSGRGVKGVDLLAADTGTRKSISIQVKTATDAHVDMGKANERWKWPIGKELADGAASKDFFVAFINLRGGPPTANDASWDPEVFIVPSAQLQRFVHPYPKRKPRMFWYVLPVRHTYKYRNRWDRIDEALA